MRQLLVRSIRSFCEYLERVFLFSSLLLRAPVLFLRHVWTHSAGMSAREPLLDCVRCR